MNTEENSKNVDNLRLDTEENTNNAENPTFRKSEGLFAIRQFHKEVPESLKTIFNSNLLKVIESIRGENFFMTKSIYFDKPDVANLNAIVEELKSFNLSIINDSIPTVTIEDGYNALNVAHMIMEDIERNSQK